MQRLPRAVLVLALCGAGAYQPSAAQQRTTESPGPAPIARNANDPLAPSITLGVGVVRGAPHCVGCLRSMGLAGLVNLSRFVNQTTALGMETTIWLNTSGPATAGLGSAMGAVTFWAVGGVPLSISGGFGFLVYHEGNAESATNTTSAGFGCSGRIGYDARVARGLALVPYIGYMNSLGRLRIGRTDQVVTNLQIGMALRFL